MTDITSKIIRKVKAEIDKKVDRGDVNGDPDLWVLLLVSDMHSRISGIETNPALMLGKWFKDYPKLSWVVFGIASLISIGGILAVMMTFLDKLGLVVIMQP